MKVSIMKQISLFILLGLFSVSCELGGPDWPPVGRCPDIDVDTDFYEAEPGEEFQFMTLRYKVIYEQLKNKKSYIDSFIDFFWEVVESEYYWRPKQINFESEKYCYKPPNFSSSDEQVVLKKRDKYRFSFLKNILPFVLTKALFSVSYAIRISCVSSYHWVYPEEETALPDENQIYFFIFKIYNKSNEVIFEKKHYIIGGYEINLPDYEFKEKIHRYYTISLPYFSKAHSVKVFVVENSIETQIAETLIASAEKIKEFSNNRTKNCHIIKKSRR